MSFKCEKCGVIFAKTQILQRHMMRKRSCVPIFEIEDLPEDKQNSPHRCKYCGRIYSRADSLIRHVSKNCKIANSEDGMEKLMEHTVQRQIIEMKTQITLQNAQVAELTSLLKTQLNLNSSLQINSKDSQINSQINSKINNGSETNIIQNIMISPWTPDGAQSFCIPVSMLMAVFTENPRLKEYSYRPYMEMADAETAAPFVLEALLEFVKRLHADPVARNVYLNPKRADQVLVFVEESGGSWKIITLIEAIRSLFDGVSGGIKKIIFNSQSLQKLPENVQSAASFVPMLYSEQDEKYIIDAKSLLSAHLTNTTPKDNSKCILVKPEIAIETISFLDPVITPIITPANNLQVSQDMKKIHLSQIDIISLMKKFPAAEPGIVSETYIKMLIADTKVDASYLVKKLWEATEDNILSCEENCTAKAVISEYDLDKKRYD